MATIERTISTTGEHRSIFKCDDVLDGDFVSSPEYSDGIRYVLLVTLVTLPCLTVIGNSMVIIAVLSHKQLKTLSNIIVASLAVADLMIALLVMPVEIYQQFKDTMWGLGKDLCLITTCFNKILTIVSIYNLCCLTINRYFVICKPFARQLMKLPVVVLMLSMCWILPIFISIYPFVFDWNPLGIEGIEDIVNYCMTGSHFVCAGKPLAALGSVLAFYIPAIIMVVCYFRIYRVARRHAHDICLHKFDAHLGRKLKNETRAKRTVFVITGCFFICWGPYYILNIAALFNGHKIPYIPWTVALWLGYVNSMFNPVLFYKYNRHYKTAFKRILSGKLCRGVSEFEHNIVPSKTSNDLNQSMSESSRIVRVRRSSDFCGSNDNRRLSKGVFV